MNKFWKWIHKELDLGSKENNKRAFHDLISGVYVGIILISINLFIITQKGINQLIGAIWFVLSFFIIVFVYYKVLKKSIYNSNSKSLNYEINNDEDLYIKALKFGKSKPNGFTLDELRRHLRLRNDDIQWMSIDKQVNQSLIFINGSSLDNTIYSLTVEDYFRLLEHEELKEARQSSKNAIIVAIIAMIISAILAGINIYYQINL